MAAWGQYRKQGGLEEVPMAMADMFAGAGRGVVRGTLGLPGDIESLGRLFVGGEQSLPTSEDWDKKLPSMTPLVPYKGRNPFDSMGQFYNLPIYGGAINALGKGVSKAAAGTSKALGYNPMRRKFMKDVGALTAAGVVGSKLAKLADDVAPPLEKFADETAPAAKAATNYKYNSLHEYNDYLNQEVMRQFDNWGDAKQNLEDIKDGFTRRKAQLAKDDEDLYNKAKGKLKGLQKGPNGLSEERALEYLKHGRHEDILDRLDEFSPQAKAEMNIFKNRFNQFADDVYAPDEPRNFATYLDSYINGEADQFFPAFNDKYIPF